jgi:hypothetical protein
LPAFQRRGLDENRRDKIRRWCREEIWWVEGTLVVVRAVGHCLPQVLEFSHVLIQGIINVNLTMVFIPDDNGVKPAIGGFKLAMLVMYQRLVRLHEVHRDFWFRPLFF